MPQTFFIESLNAFIDGAFKATGVLFFDLHEK